MIIIGLTGGIACGKSTVSNVIVEENIPLLDCDLIAREVVEPGTSARKQLVKVFSKDVPDLELPDGSLNRKALGKLVFEDAEKRKALQSITGKAIFTRLLKSMLYHWLIGTPVLVIDAPTLYETKFLIRFCSEIIVVALDADKQLERLMERDGSSREDALNRIRSQMPLEEKVKMASVVIRNDGSKEEAVEKARSEARRLQKKAWGPSILFSGPGMMVCGAALAATFQHFGRA